MSNNLRIFLIHTVDMWICCSVAANHNMSLNHVGILRHNVHHHFCDYRYFSDRNCIVNYKRAFYTEVHHNKQLNAPDKDVDTVVCIVLKYSE